MRAFLIGSTLLTALFAAVAVGRGAQPTPAQAETSCNASVVHYEQNRDAGQGLTELPWIAGGRGRQRIVGYLFYYPSVLGDRRANQERGVVIPTGGAVPSGANAKILWVPRGPSALTMLLTARQLDGPGAFRQRLHIASGGSYPSIITIPRAGCWQLTLRSGKAHATVVLQAIDAAPSGTCDATPIREEPNPALLSTIWIETIGASRPIYAVGSIHDGGSASEGATIATGGRKVMWVPSAPESVGLSLTVIGRRLDAVGIFRQQFPVAYAITPPVGPVFPSTIDIPTPGCWLLTVRGAKAAGIAVFGAVALTSN